MYSIKFREQLLQTPGLFEEFDAFSKRVVGFLLVEHNDDGTHVIAPGTTLDQTHPFVTVGNVSGLTAERALTGTANEVDITDNGAGSTVQVGLVADVSITSSLTVPTGTVTTLNVGAGAGAALGLQAITKKVTGIADNTATTVLTVTVPNGNHAATIRLLLLSSNGGTDAFESSRSAQGVVVIQRNTGVSAVATASALADAVIATNATGGSATHTLAYSAVANVEGASGTETVSIKVTIDDSGNLGSNQVVVFAEVLNAQATGVTIA